MPSVRTRLQRDPSLVVPEHLVPRTYTVFPPTTIIKLEHTRPHTRISSRLYVQLSSNLPFSDLDDTELLSLYSSVDFSQTPTDLSEISETDIEDLESAYIQEYVFVPPAQTPIPSSPSSSSSLDELELFTATGMERRTGKPLAEVLAPSIKYPPIMTPGDVTPDVLLTFTQRCKHHFKSKAIAEADQVATIAPSFQDSGVANWYLTNEARLVKLSFTDFIKEFRKRFFKRNWADNLRTELELYNMTDDDRFDVWIEKVERLNELLTDTEYHLPDTELRNHIKFHTCLKLRLAASSVDGSAKLTYEDLKEYLSLRDEERREDLAQIRAAARRALGPTSGGSSRTQTSRSSRDENTAPATARPALPKLSNVERQLLADNDGCFKCRRPFADHNSKTCPNGFPDARNYKPLTANDVQNSCPAAGPSASNKSGKSRVAAIEVDDVYDEEDDAILVAAVRSRPPTRAGNARVLPSAVLSRADDELSSSDSECVSSAFSRPHFTFHARIHAHTTLSDAVPMLIDTGSPVVLVDDALVERLQLRRRQLPKQRSFRTAWGGEEQIATEWVKLRVSSADLAWTSRSVRAIVVNGLFSPVILGMPFFAKNDCNIDPVSHSLIDRSTGSDLLHPPTPAARDTRSPRERLQDRTELERLERMLTVTRHRDVMRELQLLFRDPSTQGTSSARKILTVPPAVPSDGTEVLAALRDRIEDLAFLQTLKVEDAALRSQFADCFGDIPPTAELPTDVWHRFRLRDPDMVIARRQYECPKKYREVWKELLQEHLEAGRLVPSSSPYASPSFLIPKSDPTAKPRWVNDYRALNANTIPDVHPLPSISEILSDCGKGTFWAKLDMTNSFFQTRVHPDDQQYTAVTTPFGLYEWTVMPQGCRNAPATHQRRMYNALRPYIGSICHVYLDDIIIWSNSIEEHRKNVSLVLEALRAHHLFCSPKKTDLFCIELDFLGHHISRRGIEADGHKIDSVLSWPTPRCATHVRSFLGLVRYIAAFLPALAQHTRVLNQLTGKDAEKDFCWGVEHTLAFEAIKKLVTSRQCLTTIDHSKLDSHKIFVSCDASDYCTGAVLSFGETLESARPVAFESQPLRAAELNYPVHEKELFAIVRALKKWRVDLIGVPFHVFTDHRTLENFDKQKNLSRRQARWQEQLAQYDFDITYIEGERNCPADTMSRRPDVLSEDVIGALWIATKSLSAKRGAPLPGSVSTVNAINRLTVSADPDWLSSVRAGYAEDTWTVKLLDSLCFTLPEARRALVGDRSPLDALSDGLLDDHTRMGITVRNRLLYVGERLVIPRVNALREDLFTLAHDSLGHFGMDKSYAALRTAYYWPHMRKDMEALYLPSCEMCQRNKTPTHKPRGPLHPLPVPDDRCQSVAIDFIGPLPEDDGFNCIVTMTCRLGSDFRAIPTKKDITAEDFAALFFKEWYCNNGLPLDIVSDRDKLFVSKFWKALTKLTGVKLKMSSSYHPETDGSSERSNRTLIQALRYHVQRNQKGWARALPHVRFNFMNTVNASTGFSPFQLRHGRSPLLVPPVIARNLTAPEDVDAAALIQRIEADVMEAQDNLLLAKSSQVTAADRDRSPEKEYAVGDKVMLSTFHRRREYMQKGDKRVAKFMVRYDGPYEVVQAWPDTSVYTLELPDHLKIFPTFHASLLKPFIPNNDIAFPARAHNEPPPVITPDGVEYHIEKILERRACGRGFRYLVQWQGYGPGYNSWLPGREVKDLIQLTDFLREQGIDDPEAE